jgi:hypothetical protein
VQYMRCDYEVPGMVLLRGLHRSKDISVHVSTCKNYDLNALTTVMWKLWR